MVERYLHGISGWEPPETHVAWRKEVKEIVGDLLDAYPPADLLEDYPLKPHELVKDTSTRVFETLKTLKADGETPVWIVDDDGTVTPTTLEGLIGAGREEIEGKTILLPPSAGGLDNGRFAGDAPPSDNGSEDVADQWFDEAGEPRRARVWEKDNDVVDEMRLIRRIDLPLNGDTGDGERPWFWFERTDKGDSDGSRANKFPVLLDVHVGDVVDNVRPYLAKLPLTDDLKQALRLAAQWHDLGKDRKQFQTMLGNLKYPDRKWAKSGKRAGRLTETYRHEFGSLLDVHGDPAFQALTDAMKDLVLHFIAAHHGRGRPHFDEDEALDPKPSACDQAAVASEVPRRFARLQRKYGRWGLAYLESILRAADYAASANPSKFDEEDS
jgi:CRISPR-associated endonuclease/helicase Cas3